MSLLRSFSYLPLHTPISKIIIHIQKTVLHHKFSISKDKSYSNLYLTAHYTNNRVYK